MNAAIRVGQPTASHMTATSQLIDLRFTPVLLAQRVCAQITW